MPPTTPAPTDDTVLWLDLLVRQLPELLVELAPGTRSRPADRPEPTPAELAARDARIREERHEALAVEQAHGLTAPGHTAAPLRLHVSDALRDIGDGVLELDEAVHEKLGLGRPRRTNVPQRLLRIRRLLGRIAAEPVLAAHVRDELRRMARRCGRALGDTEPMARVSGRCPWCDSVSLRAFPARRAVLCVNPGCRCPGAECDCRTDAAFRHLWYEDSWATLARAGGADPGEIGAALDESAPAATDRRTR
ncbi:hypothetical protein RM717_02055 [Streptomyces griseus]|uniref:Uncharacterized protein n=1 Tax=Streptomyces stephensoniae TaxID=3375367 RepID=A0ABU2VUJ1_9ACTN|nr:hypothetical protein [Streptomyces griseus]MDT0489289.1 hypothetical protein [Streptomyces griseus]